MEIDPSSGKNVEVVSKGKKGKNNKRIDQEPPMDGGVAQEEVLAPAENQVLEDPFEDEFEEETVENAEDGEEGEANTEGKLEDAEMDAEEESKINNRNFKVFRPGLDKLEDGETLEYDSRFYEMYHALNVEWPCLSFDIIPDKLGTQRKRFPHTAYFVTGTQAEEGQDNNILIAKASQLHKTKFDDAESDEEKDEKDDDMDDDAELEFKTIKHPGCVNRIRVMPQEPHVAATWSENGKVYLWDLAKYISALDGPITGTLSTQALKTVTNHKSEGFALAWSILQPGILLSGDCKNKIYMTQFSDQGVWVTDSTAYTGHTASVEDLAWSPSEAQVFASSSVDKTVKIWDKRTKKGSAMTLVAADCDVNVISWNKSVSYLMASGSDDGGFKIWDLRNIKQTKDEMSESVGSFKWHSDQITSIEWDPNDESALIVSSADNSVTVWDLSMEKDDDADKTIDEDQFPAQLLFVHQGQQDVKESHYHPQIPGLIISTAENGFNFFIPDIATEEEKANTKASTD